MTIALANCCRRERSPALGPCGRRHCRRWPASGARPVAAAKERCRPGGLRLLCRPAPPPNGHTYRLSQIVPSPSDDHTLSHHRKITSSLFYKISPYPGLEISSCQQQGQGMNGVSLKKTQLVFLNEQPSLSTKWHSLL